MREERARNIRYMVVTLEVSKLSGSLNADACRAERRACGAGSGIRVEREVAGDRERPRRVGQGSTANWGQGTGGRTLNMLAMFVTLEVSKLSCWLNADAYCRESQ